jgi:predicted dehydrogenase
VVPCGKSIAGIGVGGMGTANLNALASENIVALCDVDEVYAAKTFNEHPAAKRYTDYRELLAVAGGLKGARK